MVDRELDQPLLASLGGAAGCHRLATRFYGRVAQDPVLRPLFPGRSLRCATNEFAAFLIQLLGGDGEETQHRWWLSLGESHARFNIGPAARAAWLGHMSAALAESRIPPATVEALEQFFQESSRYVMGQPGCAPAHAELALRWRAQLTLDQTVAAVREGRDGDALAGARQFQDRPALFVGLLARLIQSGRAPLLDFVLAAVARNPALGAQAFGGRPLLHRTSGAACEPVVSLLLEAGIDPNLRDRAGHTPLYAAANECPPGRGAGIVRMLVRAGADVDGDGGVTGATPLHMAARRGNGAIAAALIESGARVDVRDRKGHTPLQRALNCRHAALAEWLRARGGTV